MVIDTLADAIAERLQDSQHATYQQVGRFLRNLCVMRKA